MLKQQPINIADTNIANLGSDLEKKVREAAAEHEPAWKNAGKKEGLEIWRIEKFKVVPWPQEQYGSFYNGDSYIVLHTYKKKDSNQLCWDVHFWLGKYTTQDEAGTAAYKTVELDDLLGGAPVQHREVQGYESSLFLSYFPNGMKILEGGVGSGFNHVKPEEYEPRLLEFEGKRHIKVTQVPLTRDSLNSHGVFILDTGLKIYQWNGKHSTPLERNKASQICNAIESERNGLAKSHVIEEGDHSKHFWEVLGGEGPVKDTPPEKPNAQPQSSEKVLLKLTDQSGNISYTQVATGNNVKKSLLDTHDVFILDTGYEVFAWIGKQASAGEKKVAMQYAHDYLIKNNKPPHLPIARVLEGGENESFEQAFN
jgi:gelsolin